MIEVPDPYKEQAERVIQMFSEQLIPAKAGALPHKHFISITEALTWIAFGVPLESWAFQTADSFAIGPFGHREKFLASMVNALSQFVEKASGGVLTVRGRYLSNYSDHQAARNADTQIIQPEQLRDFARYDSLYGGFERGTGFTWEDQPIDDILHGRHDGWRDVEVCREDLEGVFPPGQPAKPSGEDVVRWCADWLKRSERAGQNQAWPEFRKAFPGSSRDDVFRPAFNAAKRQ